MAMVSAGVLAAAFLYNSSQAASDAPRQLQYRVVHSVFGDIGIYTNTIEPKGDETIVRTNVHLQVSALGVVLYREDAQRTERWRGNILREFHGVTTKDGVATKVDGQADGNAFVVLSPRGRVTAPATIRPSNPWSSDFLNSTTLMLTDTGEVERVRVDGGETTLVKINDDNILARKYQVNGSLHYKIWIDHQNIPIAFAVDDDSGEVSFFLTH
jgi:hypothetical protein